MDETFWSMYHLGLIQNTPKKFVFFSALAFLAIYPFKPDIFFNAEGDLRSWTFADPTDKGATPIPLWLFSASFQSLGAIKPAFGTMITTTISMFITILSSTKLYLNLSSNINNEIDLSKSYYILSINIFKMLSLKPTDQNPRLFLDECFSEYTKLIEQSSILIKDIKKDLLTINEINRSSSFSDSSIDSNESNNNIIITSRTEI